MIIKEKEGDVWLYLPKQFLHIMISIRTLSKNISSKIGNIDEQRNYFNNGCLILGFLLAFKTSSTYLKHFPIWEEIFNNIDLDFFIVNSKRPKRGRRPQVTIIYTGELKMLQIFNN